MREYLYEAAQTLFGRSKKPSKLKIMGDADCQAQFGKECYCGLGAQAVNSHASYLAGWAPLIRLHRYSN